MLSKREGAREATKVWDYRWRRSVQKYLNIRECQLAPLCSLQPLQRVVAVQLPSRPKIPCHRKERERNQPKKLTTSASLIRVVSLLIIQDRPLSPTPFPTSSSQNIFHASTDLWTRSTHTLTDQQNRKAELKTPTLPFMKNPQRVQSFWIQSVHQKSDISSGNAFEVRALSVRELPWASNQIPHSMLQMHVFLSLCWTRSLWPDFPWVQLALWTTPTLDSSYHACQCYSKRHILIPNDQQLCRSQSLSTSSLKALLLSTFRIPPLLSATHFDHNQHPWCKALQPKPQFYRSDPSSPSLTSALHLPKSSTELPQPSCWRSGKVSTTSPALLYRQSTLHPPSLLPTTCVFLDLLPFWFPPSELPSSPLFTTSFRSILKLPAQASHAPLPFTPPQNHKPNRLH
jgi:hypothetical protein